jgi:hypothetical protein
MGFLLASRLAFDMGSAVLVVVTLILHPEHAELPEVVVPAALTEPAVPISITINLVQGLQFLITAVTVKRGSGHGGISKKRERITI